MFEEFKFSDQQITNYYQRSLEDLKIAKEYDRIQIVFKFSYDALLKIAITLCAKNGMRVKAKKGHHVELIEKLSQILDDQNIGKVGNKMREKRNTDLYGGGAIITEFEGKEYLKFVEDIFQKAEEYLEKNRKLF